MEKFIPTFTDITNWNIIVYQNTTGSRSKKIVVNPETDQEHFFKGSKELITGEIRYPTEFWSEIVSSKIGQYLGFDVLDYNIAYNEKDKQKIGCVSKSMVSNSMNKLTEGKFYLMGNKPTYNPDKDKKDYTFQFIRKTLEDFSLVNYINNLLDIIIFDAIIGNSDRHQENWGVITKYDETIKGFDKEIKNKNNNWFLRLFLRIIRNFTKAQSQFELNNTTTLRMQSNLMINEFSQIYDSGCCLGREINEEKIEIMLSDKQMLQAYIRNGTSEIHWENISKKQNHFNLIKFLKIEYNDEILKIIDKVRVNYNENNIKKIIYNIDQNLPEKLNHFKLTENRKNLMIKLITLRIQKLFEL